MGTWPEARGSREAGLGRSGRGHESEGEEGDAAHPRSMRAVAAGESVAGSHNSDYGARPGPPRPVDLPATSSGAGKRREAARTAAAPARAAARRKTARSAPLYGAISGPPIPQHPPGLSRPVEPPPLADSRGGRRGAHRSTDAPGRPAEPEPRPPPARRSSSRASAASSASATTPAGAPTSAATSRAMRTHRRGRFFGRADGGQPAHSAAGPISKPASPPKRPSAAKGCPQAEPQRLGPRQRRSADLNQSAARH